MLFMTSARCLAWLDARAWPRMQFEAARCSVSGRQVPGHQKISVSPGIAKCRIHPLCRRITHVHFQMQRTDAERAQLALEMLQRMARDASTSGGGLDEQLIEIGVVAAQLEAEPKAHHDVAHDCALPTNQPDA